MEYFGSAPNTLRTWSLTLRMDLNWGSIITVTGFTAQGWDGGSLGIRLGKGGGINLYGFIENNRVLSASVREI